jgi:hypothetical protein
VPRVRNENVGWLKMPQVSLRDGVLAPHGYSDLPSGTHNRLRRQRTSGRTAAERRAWHTEQVTYTIDITKSDLLDPVTFGSAGASMRRLQE